MYLWFAAATNGKVSKENVFSIQHWAWMNSYDFFRHIDLCRM